MSTSGINGESRVILPGFAIALSGRKFRFAGPDSLATHIADSGAPSKGLVTGISSGVLELVSWKASTGSKFLTPGASYRVAENGRLVIGSSGQVVGTATSPTELSVSVSSTISRAYDVVSFDSGAVSVGPLNIGIGAPVGSEGRHGEYRLDLAGKKFYGPKTDYGWGQPTPLIDDSPSSGGGLTATFKVAENMYGAYWMLTYDNGVLKTSVYHPGPSSSSVLEDTSGAFWQIIADTDGNIGTSPTVGPASADIIVTDSSSVQWKLVVDTDGNLGAQLV